MRILGIQELHHKLLFFWSPFWRTSDPAWRALDPAYLRNRHEVLVDDFIADLDAYFSHTSQEENCRKAMVDLVSSPVPVSLERGKLLLPSASGIVRSCAQLHTQEKLIVIRTAAAGR